MSAEQNALKVLVIIASTRPTRVGGAVGDWIAETVRQTEGWDVSVADLREMDLPMMNEPKHPRLGDYLHEHTWKWSAVVREQDAYIIVMPEYNHSFTAPIKNALDYLSLEWNNKPVGLVSYGGVSGGLRAATTLKPALTALQMMPIPDGVAIPSVNEHIVNGVFVATDSAGRSADAMLKQLARWAEILKALRAD